MIKNIEQILTDGVMAPSGENCQPWTFEVGDDFVFIKNVKEADMSLYNINQRGSYIANGALIENIIISAKKYGYEVSVEIYPKEEDDLVAKLSFVEKSFKDKDYELYGFIKERCTNRKDYTGEKLKDEIKKEFINLFIDFPDFNLIIVDEENKNKIIGDASALHEKVLFENKEMHDFFYDHIIWEKKNEDKSGGFYIETLEFLPHQLLAVKILKNWSFLRVLNFILDVATKISKDNGKKYARSGSFMALTMKEKTKESYVKFGMLMERLWLVATKNNIAMHPCNGIIYLKDYTDLNQDTSFSKFHKSIIAKAYKDIVDSFNINNQNNIAFIFRSGKSEPPTAKSKRLPPNIEYIS